MNFTEDMIRDMLAEATNRSGSTRLKTLPGGAPVEKLYAFHEGRWRLAVLFEKSEHWWCFSTGQYIGILKHKASAYRWVTVIGTADDDDLL
jgi:hypothetical protein